MVEALGPWPGRVVLMAGLAFIGFLIALAPWLVRAAREDAARNDMPATA
jgi:hypothetical protein